jgi:hypothetical protein
MWQRGIFNETGVARNNTRESEYEAQTGSGHILNFILEPLQRKLESLVKEDEHEHSQLNATTDVPTV